MPSPESNKLEVRKDKEAIPLATNSLSTSFIGCPILSYILRYRSLNGNKSSSGSIFTTHHDDPVFRRRFFRSHLAQAYLRNAHIINVDGDWKCVGVLIPPRSQATRPFSWTWLNVLFASWYDKLWCYWRLGWEGTRYLEHTHPTLEHNFHIAAFPEDPRIMTEGDYYYIDYLGTYTEARNRGYASAFMRYAQDAAKKEGKSIYLQSSTDENRRLYESFGFVVVGEQSLGRGEVDRSGRIPDANGDGDRELEGAVWWGMTWSPEGLK